jgi:two-component system response regulator PilR (NtrC family)
VNHPEVLIIDDEPDICELLEITLSRMGIDCACAGDVSQAHALLASRPFGLCLTDMRLPDGNGLDLVSHIQQNYPSTPVAMITAHGNMECAIQALKNGAFDFLSKPIDLDVLRSLVSSALRLSADGSKPHSKLIGESEEIKKLARTISKLARSQAPVYISGDSGTGKELAACLIHEQSPRADKPFIPVNCGAIPQDLIESEFFGHKKGSFTGASSDKQGLFQAADGGTLFLDEIAELPFNMQVKLLRAIQEKSVRPVGEQREVVVDVRILSATHKDLSSMVKQGLFRQDLFYRINVIELPIPALQERREDIPLLVEHIFAKLLPIGETAPQLSAQAWLALQGYSFPGNIRELENILERALTLCDEDVIEEQDLRLPQSEITETTAAEAEVSTSALDELMVDVERKRILEALEQTRWNKTAAAKLLGISFRALRYRLEKLGLK